MLVSCSYCGKTHNRGELCQNRPKRSAYKQKDPNYINRFRSLMIWKKKRDEIKKRDLFLCQYCLTQKKYTFNKLEVHHIDPIVKKWNRRLDNNNLITLCASCHKLAENGNIPSRDLFDIANKNNVDCSL